jgi:hypothetical protein
MSGSEMAARSSQEPARAPCATKNMIENAMAMLFTVFGDRISHGLPGFHGFKIRVIRVIRGL